jgi:hypothetical protein
LFALKAPTSRKRREKWGALGHRNNYATTAWYSSYTPLKSVI